MITIANIPLMDTCLTKAKTKFEQVATYAAMQWCVNRYLSKGGQFVSSDDKDKMEAEKTAALDTIKDALEDKGFTKIDNNSFIIGQAKLNTVTLANLLEINRKPWYRYLLNDIKLNANTQELVLRKGDYFSIASWDQGSALVMGAKMGAQPIRLPTAVAYALIQSSTQLTTRERKFKNFKASKMTAADKKLTKNSPPEAKFHRGMREYHKDCCRDYDKKSPEYGMHKAYVEHHNKLYKKAMG